MKKIKKLNILSLALLLVLTIALNSVFIRSYVADNVVVAASSVETTTEYKVEVLDNNLITEEEKHNYVNEKVDLNVDSNDDTETEQTQQNAEGKETSQEEQLLTEDDIKDMLIMEVVERSVAFDLDAQGYNTFYATGVNVNNGDVYSGLGYTDFTEFPSQDGTRTNLVTSEFIYITNDDYVISEDDLFACVNNLEEDTNKYYSNDYEIEKIDSHFVLFDKYVKYNWINDRTVKYQLSDNDKSNYDKTLGKIFSYDTNEYVFDDDFTYTSQEIKSMFTQIDYDEIQNSINKINEEQKRNGYYVQEITITYIDIDLIIAWESLKVKDNFYGINLDLLNDTFGTDGSLEFSEDGIKQGEVIKPTNWLKVGLFTLAGCAAILIGAAIAPLTGGCSFGASLLLIAKLTAIAVVTDLAIQTAIGTISGVVQGQSFWNALDVTIKNTFTPEKIAESFMMGAIMSAVMVGSGLVKACFVENTPILTANGCVNIQDIKVGDYVTSFDENTNTISEQEVTDVMVGKSDDFCNIALSSGEVISSTALHPWYVQNKGWTAAFQLKSNDILLTNTGEYVTILGVSRQKLENQINVYNITVNDANDEAYHTYFVGCDNLLVHNTCKTNADKVNQKPIEKHHFFTNKSSKYTKQFQGILDKYDDLALNGKNGGWNIEAMPHRGRHPYAYHDFMLKNLEKIDKFALENTDDFLRYFDQVKKFVIQNDSILTKQGWLDSAEIFNAFDIIK